MVFVNRVVTGGGGIWVSADVSVAKIIILPLITVFGFKL